MPFNQTIVADAVLAALIENKGIYGQCNRSYDGLVAQGATSVDIPAMPDLVVKTTGSASDDVDRKGIKAGTTMINVPLGLAAIPIKEELLARFETNGKLMTDFVNGARNSFGQYFDAAVLNAALGTTQTDTFDDTVGNKLSWPDIIAVSAAFNSAKVPDNGRIIVIPSALEAEFYAIDVVKNAVAYNAQYLEGQFLRIRGMNFFVSGLLGQKTAGKNNLLGIYGPGLAFILSRFMESERVYDPALLQTNIDFLSHYGVKLLKPQYAVVIAEN
jgi:hypothetical protein